MSSGCLVSRDAGAPGKDAQGLHEVSLPGLTDPGDHREVRYVNGLRRERFVGTRSAESGCLDGSGLTSDSELR